MAFTARNGERIGTPTLRKWEREVRMGKRTKVDIERNELGVFTARGKYLTRLFESELGIDTGIVLR